MEEGLGWLSTKMKRWGRQSEQSKEVRNDGESLGNCRYDCEVWFIVRQFRKLLHSLGERESSKVRHYMLHFFRVPWSFSIIWLGKWIFHRNCCCLIFLVHSFIVPIEAYHMSMYRDNFSVSFFSLSLSEYLTLLKWFFFFISYFFSAFGIGVSAFNKDFIT